MIHRFAQPYAEALLKAALKAAKDTAPATVVRDELRALADAMAAAPALGRMAANPGVPPDVKDRLMREVLQRLGANALTSSFVLLLLRNYRLTRLPAILDAFEALLNRKLGVAIAEVRTAQPLDSGARQRLESTLGALAGRRLDLRLAVDPSLLAGFVATIESDFYDASLRGQLRRLTERLAEAAVTNPGAHSGTSAN